MVWNPLSQPASPYLRLPVSGAGWLVSNATGSVASQISLIDNRTLSLPLLYLNRFGNFPRPPCHPAILLTTAHNIASAVGHPTSMRARCKHTDE